MAGGQARCAGHPRLHDRDSLRRAALTAGANCHALPFPIESARSGPAMKSPRLNAIRNIAFRQPRHFQPPAKGEVLVNADRRYFIGDAIRQVRFGIVYDCIDDWGNGLEAKILIPHDKSYREVRRVWQDELRKLLVMRHPNITFVYDAFEYKDTFYLIIERCSFPLSNLIARRALEADSWIPYVASE